MKSLTDLHDSPRGLLEDYIAFRFAAEDEARSAWLSARVPKGLGSSREVCSRGHPLSPDRAGRVCLVCRREYDARKRAGTYKRDDRAACRYGHPLDGVRTKKTDSGTRMFRYCKTCHRNANGRKGNEH